MRVPDKFPDGCVFVPTFGGDEYVKFPDGKVFKLSDDGVELREVRSLPSNGGVVENSSPAGFLAAAKSARAAAKAAA